MSFDTAGVRRRKLPEYLLKIFIGFIQRFVSWAASHLAERKELRGAVQNKGFYEQKGVGTRGFTRQKVGRLLQGHLALGEGKGSN